jgi:DNA-binding NarL/FixJ family response regulator
MKLLIVEDNPGVRKVIRNLVASVAREICECADGAEVLALFRREQPDFVLMDIQMEGVDGITATRQLKAVDPTARVIIVTDYDQPDLREAAYQAGACGYVSKENLLELVRLLKEFDEEGGKLTQK